MVKSEYRYYVKCPKCNNEIELKRLRRKNIKVEEIREYIKKHKLIPITMCKVCKKHFYFLSKEITKKKYIEKKITLKQKPFKYKRFPLINLYYDKPICLRCGREFKFNKRTIEKLSKGQRVIVICGLCRGKSKFYYYDSKTNTYGFNINNIPENLKHKKEMGEEKAKGDELKC